MARSKSNPQVVLRPQDLVVVLRLALERGSVPTYATLATELTRKGDWVRVRPGFKRCARILSPLGLGELSTQTVNPPVAFNAACGAVWSPTTAPAIT